jgi:hypothetical protein
VAPSCSLQLSMHEQSISRGPIYWQNAGASANHGPRAVVFAIAASPTRYVSGGRGSGLIDDSRLRDKGFVQARSM